MKTLQHPLIRWLPALAMMAVIYYGSSLPSNEVPHFQGGWDFVIKKAGHFSAYGLLSLAFLWGQNKTKPRAFWIAWLLAVLYALTDEYHQSFTPGRSPRLTDVGIDGAGAAYALFTCYRWLRARR